MLRIAVIGAGLSGLTIARALEGKAEIRLFEKARGVSGRMSTRYADPFYFDHGAQCFTARTKAFQAFLAPYIAQGVVSEWQGKVINLELGKKVTKRMWFEQHLVASPNMNSLCKQLAEGVDISLETEVAPLAEKQADGWHLYDSKARLLGVFDWVISTAPPAQTLALFHRFLGVDSPPHRARMQGCYALMIGFNKPWDKAWIAAKVRDNPIKWISVNSTKPQRNQEVTAIVAHSRHQWAEQHMDDDVPVAQAFLLAQFEAVTGIECSKADFITTHRWRYAIVEETQKAGIYLDAAAGLAATSDWSSTSRIEEVWLNAMECVRRLPLE